jgi:hypothetical protein
MASNAMNNRQNLSKSIILHHNKLSTLLSTVGRYNDILVKDNQHINETEESDEDEDRKFPNQIDDDDNV